jgi:hypothetical protein
MARTPKRNSSKANRQDQLRFPARHTFAAVTILSIEPLPHAMLDETDCEEAYLAIADMIVMRMPFTFGHSRAVAALAEATGKRTGLSAADIRAVRWAAYTHDIGEISIPVSTWMRASALTERETDAARLHPYHGERALSPLGGDGKAIAALVLRHHERLETCPIGWAFLTSRPWRGMSALSHLRAVAKAHPRDLPPSLRGALATKQSIARRTRMWIVSLTLAMTGDRPVMKPIGFLNRHREAQLRRRS